MTTPRIDQLLEVARQRLRRVEVDDLDAEVAAGALVVDIRPEVNRRDEGELPGAAVVDRIVLEWRLDPTSPACLPEAAADEEAHEEPIESEARHRQESREVHAGSVGGGA